MSALIAWLVLQVIFAAVSIGLLHSRILNHTYKCSDRHGTDSAFIVSSMLFPFAAIVADPVLIQYCEIRK